MQIVCFKKGVFRLNFVNTQNFKLHALILAHATGALEFLHPRARMRQPDRAGNMVVHRVIDRLAQATVKLG